MSVLYTDLTIIKYTFECNTWILICSYVERSTRILVYVQPHKFQTGQSKPNKAQLGGMSSHTKKRRDVLSENSICSSFPQTPTKIGTKKIEKPSALILGAVP